MYLTNELSSKSSIKDWSVQDRPREKLLSKGRKSLSDVELLAIILGSGNLDESAVDLSRRILLAHDNSLQRLAKASINDLKRFKGVGPAKAVNILAAVEIAARISNSTQEEVVKITCSNDIFNCMRQDFHGLQVEEFWLVLLNTANKVIGKQRIGIGGVSGVVADVKVIMKLAIEHMATSIILAHNHPSANKKASQQDINLTNKVRESAKLMDISLLDHIIFCGDNYFSFADEGLL
jgi:DNA repair protein RadC